MKVRVLVALVAVLAAAPTARAGEGSSSALPEEVLPLAALPNRPKPFIELGEPFLGTGTLAKGFKGFTGAIWQPSLLLWGDLRTALHGIEQDGTERNSQWVNRLNLFTQLFLTPTERVLISFRPLDENGQFSGYTFFPEAAEGEIDAFNHSVSTVYFEGDFGELFPFLDRNDTRGLDFGFSVGRAPFFFQDGMLLDDALNSVAVVRNTLRPPGVANLRVTGVYGWGHVNRGGNNRIDESAKLFGLFTEIDVAWSQIAVDVVYVNGDLRAGDAVYAGLSGSQVIGDRFNTVLRVVTSQPVGGAHETAALGRGVLIFGEFSWVPRRTHDNAYITAFGAIDNFTPAARVVGGPLEPAGIMFEGAGLGSYAPVLSNRSRDVVGGAIGYQRFINLRTQIVFEAATRYETEAEDFTVAFGIRFQKALGRRFIVRLDAFGVGREGANLRYGGRTEIRMKF